MSNFKEKNTFDFRLSESNRIRNKFPDKTPVIVEKGSKSTLPEIDKNKYLVPSDITMAQFMYIIRKRLTLPPETALFLYIDSTFPTTSSLIKEIYSDHRDEDGFLYIQYTGENTFG